MSLQTGSLMLADDSLRAGFTFAPCSDSFVCDHRIPEIVKTAKARERTAVPKYASAPHPRAPARADFDGLVRARGGRKHCGTVSPVGWSDPAHGDQFPEGTYRLGYAVGYMTHPPMDLQPLEGSLGGEAYAFSYIPIIWLFYVRCMHHLRTFRQARSGSRSARARLLIPGTGWPSRKSTWSATSWALRRP